RVGAGEALGYLRQRGLGAIQVAQSVLRQADLEQRARGLVVGRIALDQDLELLARHLVVLGDVVALAEPVPGIGRVHALRVGLQEGQEQVGRGDVVAGLSASNACSYAERSSAALASRPGSPCT